MGFFKNLFGGGSKEDPAPAGPQPGNAAAKEAASLARLLIAEMVLYNEDAIEAARRRGNIYAALKDEIDGSRKMYDDKVDPRTVDQDYFYLEMVARLAKGNPEILGVPAPNSAKRSPLT